MRLLIIIGLLCIGLTAGTAQESDDDIVDILPINDPCQTSTPQNRNPARSCEKIDALFFVHGIYGSEETFENGDFNWPKEIVKEFGDRFDVYVVEYPTKLLSWLKKDIAWFDDISASFFDQLHGHPIPGWGRYRDGLLTKRPYRSVGFIGHSLGEGMLLLRIFTP